MTVRPENLLTGGLLGLLGLGTVALNLSVMVIMFKKGFLSRGRSSGVYVLALGTVVGDTLQQLLTVTYVAPTSIFQVRSPTKIFSIVILCTFQWLLMNEIGLL